MSAIIIPLTMRSADSQEIIPSLDQQVKFAPICQDFVVELRSEGDRTLRFYEFA
jgi:hypothetical protein